MATTHIRTGHLLPYGILVGASPALRREYYVPSKNCGRELPELPEQPDEIIEWDEVDHRIDAAALVAWLAPLLHQRAWKVLHLRYIVGMTRTEVSKVYGVTCERIRQIEGRAIRRAKYLFWQRRVDI